MRDNTKEGFFGSIPYSFATSSMRSRCEVSFCLSLLSNQGAWNKTKKNVLHAFGAKCMCYILLDVVQLQGKIVYNIVFDVIQLQGLILYQMLFDLILILVSKLIRVSSFFSLAMKRNISNFIMIWMFCQRTDQRYRNIILMFANGIFFFRISLRMSTKFILTSSLLITNASFISRLLVKK